MNVTTTLVPLMFCEAQDKGGVNEMLVLVDIVQTVVEALPQVATMVCVKLESCFVTAKFSSVPKVPLATERLDLRAILVSVSDPLALHVPGEYVPLAEKVTEMLTVFVPSSLWGMSAKVKVAIVFVVLLPDATFEVYVAVFVVPFTVHEIGYLLPVIQPQLMYCRFNVTVTSESLFGVLTSDSVASSQNAYSAVFCETVPLILAI